MYKNEIVRIDDTLDENGKPASQVAQGWIIGEPINVYYDYLIDGIFSMMILISLVMVREIWSIP